MRPTCRITWRRTHVLRRTVSAAWLSLVFLSQGEAGPALRINRAQVNVRADATVQSGRIAVLKEGDEVERIDSKNEWLHVRMSDGLDGWVHSALVQERLTVEGRGVRIRAAASTSAPAVTMVPKGTELTKLRQQGNWLEVSLPNGKSGWIWKKLVREKVVAYEVARDASSPTEKPRAKPSEPEPPPPAAPVTPVVEEPAVVRANPYAEGLKFEEKGDYRSALGKFEDVLTEDPNNVSALAHVATAYKQLGAYDEAVENLNLARDKSSGRRDILLELGEVYRLKGITDSTRKYQALFRGESWIPEPKIVQKKDTPQPQPEEDTTWIYLGIGAVALALVALSAVLLRRPRKPKARSAAKKAAVKESSEGFSRKLEESTAPAASRITPGSESEIDHRIKEKWDELKQGNEMLAGAASTASNREGSENDHLDQLVGHLDVLRQAMEMQDERAQTYADLVRLQNMKIEAMIDEIRLLRRGA
jgi:tetratricopeptide (TPR) repeat protein/SH3-like domain-containing protein